MNLLTILSNLNYVLSLMVKYRNLLIIEPSEIRQAVQTCPDFSIFPPQV
jgi:hypothetical protein